MTVSGAATPKLYPATDSHCPIFRYFSTPTTPFTVMISPQLFPLPIVSLRYRHTRSTLRHNRFCGHRWDNYPISVSAAKMDVFVRRSTVTREHYTVTLNHKCRHPYFYRHPTQAKVNRHFLNFGCRYGQQFLPTAGFRFYCHPIHHKQVQVFASRDFCAY